MTQNPKILHRIYFDDRPPYRDPFAHFEATWRREMPDYTIMKWNSGNVDLAANEWMRRANAVNSPVFMSEFIRWEILKRFGGMYLDADCEVLNGPKLAGLIDELYASDKYDAFIGVEEKGNGHPTAQTIAVKPGSELVEFMHKMYTDTLSGSLWHWREERGLIGPQLMSLYFRDRGFTKHKGFFCHMEEPQITARVKVYTQDYFSPKFTINGTKLNYTENTVIYHLFSNLNMELHDPEKEKHRRTPLLFEDYCKYLAKLEAQNGGVMPEPPVSVLEKFGGIRNPNGSINLLRLVRFAIMHPKHFWSVAKQKVKRS
jgi:hypothetical protein